MDVTVYGYGGDDKIIGGITIGNEKFYGGDGDDKIWMIHPNRRSLDAAGAPLGGATIQNLAEGGNGDDNIYLYTKH